MSQFTKHHSTAYPPPLYFAENKRKSMMLLKMGNGVIQKRDNISHMSEAERSEENMVYMYRLARFSWINIRN